VSKVWFVTGAARGFGRAWVQAALARGDRVAATARDIHALSGLTREFGDLVLPQRLDVTDRAGVFAAVAAAQQRFGRIDVVVNNAGYGLFGAVEEVDEAAARAQLETNFFGALWVTQAALPYLRRQRSGHLVQVSSLSGVVGFPLLGLYQASKFALEGLTESVAQEMAEFGVKVTLLEPGAFRTDWAGVSAAHAEPLPAYAGLRARLEGHENTYHHGDPVASAQYLLQLVDTPDPPLRLMFGRNAVELAVAASTDRIRTWQRWEQIAKAAAGD